MNHSCTLFFVPIVILCKCVSEYLSYQIGLVPSLFYANLSNPTALAPLLRHLLLLTLLSSLVKFLTDYTKCRLEVSLHRAYTMRLLYAEHKEPVGDIEQRILDDALDRAKVECTILSKSLLPVLVIVYTVRCYSVIPYKFTVPMVYGMALLAILVVKPWMRVLKKRLAEQDKWRGETKSKLCRIFTLNESISMTRLQPIILHRFQHQFEHSLTTMQLYNNIDSFVKALFYFISLSGALTNYLIMYHFITSGTDTVTAERQSLHSFLCLQLIYYLNETVEFVELFAKRRVFINRMRTFDGDQHYTIGFDIVEFDRVSVPHLDWTLSFSTRSHRVTIIEGDNGTGKTTIVRLITGHSRPKSGTITTNTDVFTIPQGPLILDGLVIIDDLFGPLDIDRMEQCLRAVGVVRTKNITMTPGEWQRLHLARLLYYQPRLAVLDEPCSHMDDSKHDLLPLIIDSLPNTVFIILTPNHQEIDHKWQLIKLPAKSGALPIHSPPPRSSPPLATQTPPPQTPPASSPW